MDSASNTPSKRNWFSKNWSNILFVILVILFLIPSTRFHIQVYINRAFSFSPSIVDKEQLNQLTDYNWQLRNEQNELINFKASKGKVVLINFWASWCGPCVAEMPSLQELYNLHHNEVDFYFVARDKQKAIQQFMANENFDFPVYYEQENTPELLQSNQLPTTYLIDKEGKIWISKTGAADWNSEELNDLLEKLITE
jgi:thiol-disulfide isomerase/thioredoxin